MGLAASGGLRECGVMLHNNYNFVRIDIRPQAQSMHLDARIHARTHTHTRTSARS